MIEFKRKPIEGIFALMPLCLKENQEIDYEGIRWNIEWLEKKGIPGFIQFGGMGQMNAPSEEEFNKVCDVIVGASKDKKIACVVCSTAPNTKEAIRRAKYAEDAGADGSMLMLPYAFPVITEWALEFYRMVDKALKGELAIILYNFPPGNGFNVTPRLWREHLLEIKSIKAVKESARELSQHFETLTTVEGKINFFSCRETYFWHDSILGGKGITGIFTWVAPKVMLKWYDECIRGNQKDPWTLKVYKLLLNAYALWTDPNMPPAHSYEHGYLNALVEIGGAKAGPPRKPYGRLPQEAIKVLEETVRPLIEMEKRM